MSRRVEAVQELRPETPAEALRIRAENDELEAFDRAVLDASKSARHLRRLGGVARDMAKEIDELVAEGLEAREAVQRRLRDVRVGQSHSGDAA